MGELGRIRKNPGKIWLEQRREIVDNLTATSVRQQQLASYAFVKAATAGAVDRLSPREADQIVDGLRTVEPLVTQHVAGGVAATLYHGSENVRRMLGTRATIDALADLIPHRRRSVSKNSLIGLSLLSLEWAEETAEIETVPERCARHLADEGGRARYASLTLANLAHAAPQALRDQLSTFRRNLDEARSPTVLASLAFCLGQTLPISPKTGLNSERRRLSDVVDVVVDFAIDRSHPTHLRALALESLQPFCIEFKQAVLDSSLVDHLSRLLNENTVDLQIPSAAVAVASALSIELSDSHDAALRTIETADEVAPDIRTAAATLRQRGGSLRTGMSPGESDRVIQYIDKAIVNVTNSQNVAVFSADVRNEYHA